MQLQMYLFKCNYPAWHKKNWLKWHKFVQPVLIAILQKKILFYHYFCNVEKTP